MTSFFPADAATLPTFTCTDCGIYARVRGELMLGLLRQQAERCTRKGHQVMAANFEVWPAGQETVS